MMKIKIVSIFVLSSFISTPLLVLDQQIDDAKQAIVDAETRWSPIKATPALGDAKQAIVDAETDVEEPYGWFAGTFLTSIAFGCLGGSVWVSTSQVFPTEPPAHRFIGKSPEYVRTYTHTYKKETKQRRLIYTSAGCIGGSAIAGLIVAYTYSLNY